MIGLNIRAIFFIVFISAVAYLIWRDRENVQRESILFFRRTERGVEIIDRIAKKLPRFWKVYGWTGVALAILSIPLVLYQVVLSISIMVSSGSTEAGPSLILPGTGSHATFQSGASFIPVEYWVISIAVIMFVHELSHGIVARSEDFEINSVGWIVLGFIPGAFVEPKGENMLPGEERDSSQGLWDQGSWTSRLKVLSAGSFANYLTALVFLLVGMFVFTSTTMPTGVEYVAQNGGPANMTGMNSGVIYSIDGRRVRHTSELLNVSGGINPGETVSLWTSEGNFSVVAEQGNRSDHGYIGIYMFKDRGFIPTLRAMVRNSHELRPGYKKYRAGLEWIIPMFEIVALLNFLIGFFNMLPAKPLDGGQVVDTFLERFRPSMRKYLNYWSLAVWAVLIASLLISIVAMAVGP